MWGVMTSSYMQLCVSQGRLICASLHNAICHVCQQELQYLLTSVVQLPYPLCPIPTEQRCRECTVQHHPGHFSFGVFWMWNDDILFWLTSLTPWCWFFSDRCSSHLASYEKIGHVIPLPSAPCPQNSHAGSARFSIICVILVVVFSECEMTIFCFGWRVWRHDVGFYLTIVHLTSLVMKAWAMPSIELNC